MNLGTAHIIRADSRNLPLADNSVDLVVTSPPYFALRSYQDGGEHYAGQLGSEPTPAEFVAALLEVTRECMRVLKPSGSLWVNLGDKYAGSGGNVEKREGFISSAFTGAKRGNYGIQTKSLMGIPWRYALACIDDLGLILRAEVVWSKPNGLPESVTDRVRRSHEQWFHFTLEPRYFSAVDEIREPHLEPHRMGRTDGTGKRQDAGAGTFANGNKAGGLYNPLGKLPGSVWTVATEPLRVPERLGIDHFAAFPTEWPRRIIQGWSPAGVCVECGEGRRPVMEKLAAGKPRADHGAGAKYTEQGDQFETPGRRAPFERTPWAEGVRYTVSNYICSCPQPTAPTTPAVVLDPFGGTGTTAMVAKALGRTGISVDMSADYCRLATWRTNDRDQLAKVLGVAKAEQQDDDQLDLFAEEIA